MGVKQQQGAQRENVAQVLCTAKKRSEPRGGGREPRQGAYPRAPSDPHRLKRLKTNRLEKGREGLNPQRSRVVGPRGL